MQCNTQTTLDSHNKLRFLQLQMQPNYLSSILQQHTNKNVQLFKDEPVPAFGSNDQSTDQAFV